MGIARPGVDAKEDALAFHFRLLQAMDRVSLALCCTNEPFHGIKQLPPRPGAGAIGAEFRKVGDFGLVVNPWLFGPDSLNVEVEARRIPRRRYSTDQEFRDVYRDAAVETLRFSLKRPNE